MKELIPQFFSFTKTEEEKLKLKLINSDLIVVTRVKNAYQKGEIVNSIFGKLKILDIIENEQNAILRLKKQRTR